VALVQCARIYLESLAEIIQNLCKTSGTKFETGLPNTKKT